MSAIYLKPISVYALYEIASNISLAKTNALISKYYNDILVAAHEGRFSISFRLTTDEFGRVCCEEWAAMEAVEKFFYGIRTSYDYSKSMYNFQWFTPM